MFDSSDFFILISPNPSAHGSLAKWIMRPTSNRKVGSSILPRLIFFCSLIHSDHCRTRRLRERTMGACVCVCFDVNHDFMISSSTRAAIANNSPTIL